VYQRTDSVKLRHQLLQLGVLLTQLLELPNLARLQSAVLLLPAIKRLLGNTKLPRNIRCWLPSSRCFTTATICSTEYLLRFI
jgi:hypothetical protein